MKQKRDWRVFFNSVFFVLGFSIIFALVGVLLQTTLRSVSYSAQLWLGRVGGIVIILFGLVILGLIKPTWLQTEHRLFQAKRFRSGYATSFAFGAAFAVGWTPCVGPILGAILTLAVTNPASAFFLLTAYALGLGVPFLLVGLFANKAQQLIATSGKKLTYLTYIFGSILIILGILVYTGQLERVANVAFASQFLLWLDVGNGLGAMTSLSAIIAFIAGIASFLSPCVLPLIPAFLVYLGTTIKTDETKKKKQ